MTDAERAVIGAILLDSRVFVLAEKEVSGEDFEDMRLGELWSGIARMIHDRQPVDVLTVSSRLAEWCLRGIDAADLHKLVADVPTASNVAHYARLVRDDSVRRQIRQVSAKAIARADEGKVKPAETVADAIKDFRDVQSGAIREQLDAKRLDDVAVQDTEYDWLIDGLLERKDRLIVTGSEGAGKSTFVRQFAVMSAAGIHPFTQKPIVPLNVLVVDAENSERQWARAVHKMLFAAKAKGAGDPGTNVRLACSPRLDITRDSHLGQIHRLIDEHQPDLVCIGPLYRLSPNALQTDDDAAPVLAALDTIRDRNLALIIEAHAGHAMNAGGERNLRPRGSSALLGWPEFGYGLRLVPATGEMQFSQWRGDRDARDWPELLRKGNQFPFEVVR